jgi:hypothetical protein
MTRRTYRRPADYRRKQLDAARGADAMWKGLAALYGRHEADPAAATAVAAQRQKDDAVTQERIRQALARAVTPMSRPDQLTIASRHGPRVWTRGETMIKTRRLGVWQSDCVVCGEPFETLAPRKADPARSDANAVACEQHRLTCAEDRGAQGSARARLMPCPQACSRASCP